VQRFIDRKLHPVRKAQPAQRVDLRKLLRVTGATSLDKLDRGRTLAKVEPAATPSEVALSKVLDERLVPMRKQIEDTAAQLDQLEVNQLHRAAGKAESST
jgi:hypothetical protein